MSSLATLPLPESLAGLIADREVIARRFAQPIASCVRRYDTSHPAFHGCIDWHSAVHGAWALVAYTRATGDQTFAPLIDETLAPGPIAEEHAFLKANRSFEMPYGRAWFLRLAIEYRRWRGDDRLGPIAAEVADSLFDHVMGNDTLLDEAYANLSWASINLIDYFAATEDRRLTPLKGHLRERILSGKPCDDRADGGHFFSACLFRAWLATRVLDDAEFGPWIRTYERQAGLPVPVAHPSSAHHFGLNFSRAWALWDLYGRTGDLRFAELYSQHFRAGFDDPNHWEGDYRAVGHWVAQFGVFALQPLFGPLRGR